ncbi:MAG: VPLPA-CTERM-specific exosortase XrtD [Deltaproteobacteria bacterium]|nr:VPLPA-CTERM-specific exosortase XrtD [Deltaproteobacteria bacterium]
MSANNIKKNIQLWPTVFVAISVACLVTSYWTGLQKMNIRWSTGDNNYCYLVVPLFLYLLWDLRNKGAQSSKLKAESSQVEFSKDSEGSAKLSNIAGFKFEEFSWNLLGLVPIFFSIGLILVGELGSVETLLYIGVWGCIAGLALLLYGWRIRYLIFPLIILAFIAPLPPFVNRMLTFQLKLAASTLATLMLRVSGVTVFQDGNIIDLGITQLQVVDACSGLRYLIPLLLLALLVGYFFSKGLWRKVVLLFFVIPISVLLNSFRIWVTGILTINGHGKLAENLFHDFTGWLIFMIAGAILFGVTLILKRIGIYKGSKHIGDPGGMPVKGMTKPIVLTAIVCLMFVTSGYALKQIPSADNLPPRTAFKSFPMKIGQWQGKRSYIQPEILDELWSDDYVQATYFHSNKRNAIHVLIPFYEWQGTRHTAHAPQSCLLGGGWALTQSKERSLTVTPGKDISIMTMTLEKGNSKILGSYFFYQRGRVITNPWMNKAYLMWDAVTQRRTDGALVRAEIMVAPGQSVEKTYPILEDFLVRLWEILPEYVPM